MELFQLSGNIPLMKFSTIG